MVNAWNVGEIGQMTLPPCHYGFQVYTRELSYEERCDLFGHNNSLDRDYSYSKWLDDNGYPKRAISLMFNMRSNDMPLGSPFNVASYALLLEILAKTVNMVSDELICNIGDSHIYIDQIDGINEQLTREPYPLPTLKINTSFLDIDIDKLDNDMFELVDYKSHPSIKMPLSN
jgi:thymidylate synthase